MGLTIKRENKTIRIGSTLALILGFIAFIIAIFEGGIGCLLIIPFFFIGLFGSILGALPFVGPILYYLGIGWIFKAILGLTPFQMPISTGIIFYSNLVFSMVYCFVTSALTVIFLILRRKIKVTFEKKGKIMEMLKNIGKQKKDRTT